MKPREREETKTQEISRIWKTIAKKINKKLKEEYPTTKERELKTKEGEEWEKKNDEVIKKLIEEIEESKKRRKEEDKIRTKKVIEALKIYKDLRKGGFEIIGKKKKEKLIDITGKHPEKYTKIKRKEKEIEEIIKIDNNIIKGEMTKIKRQTNRKIRIIGIEKNKNMQNQIEVKIGTTLEENKTKEEQEQEQKRERAKQKRSRKKEEKERNKEQKKETRTKLTIERENKGGKKQRKKKK